MTGFRAARVEAERRRRAAVKQVEAERARMRAADRGHLLSGFGGGPSDIPYCNLCHTVLPEPGSKCSARGNE